MSYGYPSWDEVRSSLWTAGRTFPQIDDETPTFLGTPLAESPQELAGADVVIIGSPYVASANGEYAGLPEEEWLAGPRRVRQQSVRYRSGYLQDFDVDVLEHLQVVDYGDAELPLELGSQTPEGIIAAQAAVERKVNEALDAGALPVVIGQNSPCGSYSIAKCLAERATGALGIVSLDAHWDIAPIDELTMDPRIAGGSSWLHKTIEFHDQIDPRNLVEIGPSGMLEDATQVRSLVERGARLYSGWEVKRLGIEAVCAGLDPAYEGTSSVYAHFDMDMIGGAGPASGDLLGELAEPLGLTEYEVLRLAYEVGCRGVDGFSFICIPPGSPAVYRLVVNVVGYLLAGRIRRGPHR